jgi:hypothetical protein
MCVQEDIWFVVRRGNELNAWLATVFLVVALDRAGDVPVND